MAGWGIKTTPSPPPVDQLIRRSDTNEQHVKDAYDRKEINSELN